MPHFVYRNIGEITYIRMIITDLLIQDKL